VLDTLIKMTKINRGSQANILMEESVTQVTASCQNSNPLLVYHLEPLKTNLKHAPINGNHETMKSTHFVMFELCNSP